MANIKVNNVSICDKCRKNNNCSSQADFEEFVDKVNKTSYSYNSIDAKVSIKCKKEIR